MTDLEELVQMLASPTAGVRNEACLKMKHVSESSKQAVLALEAATRDDDPEVAAAARFALEADIHSNLLSSMDRDVPKPTAQATSTPSHDIRSPDSGTSSSAAAARLTPGDRPLEGARRDWPGLQPEDERQLLLTQIFRFPLGLGRADTERAIHLKEDDPASRRCCNCGQRPGGEYAFYFGNWLSSTSTLTANVRTTQSKYVVQGRRTAFVCDSCITQKLRGQYLLAAGIPVLVVLAVIGLWVIDSMVHRATGQGWEYDIRSPLALASVYAVAGGGFLRELALVVDLVGTPRYEVGQRIALDSQRAALFELGYRACWTERAYMKSR